MDQVPTLRSSFADKQDLQFHKPNLGGASPRRGEWLGQGAEVPITTGEVKEIGNPVRDSEHSYFIHVYNTLCSSKEGECYKNRETK